MKVDKDPVLAELERLSQGSSILYVEDDEAVRVEVDEILSSVFPRVVSVESGYKALELVERENFIIVITDINMPGMNGIELIQKIQNFKPKQTFLVTSGYSDAKYLVPLINFGISSFILKPLNWSIFFNMLRKEISYARSIELENQYQRRLEKEIQIRTQELQDAQVRIVKLQEAKDNMLALISHELRTPLNGILGFAELIRTNLTDPEAIGYLDYIEESARRLERSTQKALDFAILSTGTQNIERKTISLKVVAYDAWVSICSRWNLKESDQPLILGTERSFVSDQSLTTEAFKNIFENGIKYAGIRMPLELTLETDSKWSVVTIQDSGPGFSANALAKLFQPFSSGNIMHHSEGMGLGLALTGVIMLTLGGKIEAGNNDRGGWVKLSFPVIKEQAERS